MDLVDDFFYRQSEANADGTLTVGEAGLFGFYRLLNGDKAGRVIIKTCAKIDGDPVCFFANGLTWIYTEKIKDVLCERVHPNFSSGNHPIDYGQASWYPDGSDTRTNYEW